MKSTRKMSKKEIADTQSAIDVLAIALILMFLVNAYESVPVIKDIIGQHYVTAHGEYSYQKLPYSKFQKDYYEHTLVSNNDELHLRSVGQLFSYSDYYETPQIGTVWYAENSHIILEFIPDESADNK